MAKSTTSKNTMVGTKVKAVSKPIKEIGIDTNDTFTTDLITSAASSMVDISKLEGFSTVTQTREQIYRMIDTMAEDPILASYLKTISEDAVEINDKGQVVWCESSDENCAKYVTYLLDSLNIDKNAFRWMHSLIKYGDLYLRLYRQSDYQEVEEHVEKTRSKLNESKDNNSLKEDVNVVLHDNNDHYVHYAEMVPNPGEMFELTKFGKTMAFVRAPINIQTTKNQGMNNISYLMYKMKQHEVEVYGATDFVHASLDDNSSRVPEEVEIFNTDKDFKNETKANTFTVKRGQSELANVFKIWRELSLLENSALLNRITKSSVIRTIQVEVGNMPKEQVGTHLNAIKSLMEQKSALNEGKSMAEYTNPGPIENNIYLPTRQGIGGITASTIGGDFDPKQLTDISYFQDKLFGALGIPKAFFGVTDDGAGFNGGTSLAIQSSRYGKSVKRVQNTFCQMITDLVNLMLLDKGLTNYINKFTIRMQSPVTQEELDRREAKKNKVGVIGDIMMQLSDVSNPKIKLKILKSLLADSIGDAEILGLLQEQIDELEEESTNNTEETTNKESTPSSEESSFEPEIPMPNVSSEEPSFEPSTETSTEEPSEETVEEPSEETTLPTPNSLGLDMTDNSQF